MNYITMLYFSAIALFLGGFWLGIEETFGINPFIWALAAGIILAILYLHLYLRAISKLRDQIREVKVYGYPHKR